MTKNFAFWEDIPLPLSYMLSVFISNSRIKQPLYDPTSRCLLLCQLVIKVPPYVVGVE